MPIASNRASSRDRVLLYLPSSRLMNRTTIPRTDAPGRAVVSDSIDLREARLWDRARLNLRLLYSGRREGESRASQRGSGIGGTLAGRGHGLLIPAQRNLGSLFFGGG